MVHRGFGREVAGPELGFGVLSPVPTGKGAQGQGGHRGMALREAVGGYGDIVKRGHAPPCPRQQEGAERVCAHQGLGAGGPDPAHSWGGPVRAK